MRGRKAYPYSFGADGVDHRLRNLEQEAHSILDGTAVRIGAVIAAVAQKLVDEVAVGRVNLGPSKPAAIALRAADAYACTYVGISSSVSARGIAYGTRPAGVNTSPSIVMADAETHFFARWQEARMRGATGVPELRKNAPTGRVDAVRDCAPRHHLFIAVDARPPRPPFPLGSTCVASVMSSPPGARYAWYSAVDAETRPSTSARTRVRGAMTMRFGMSWAPIRAEVTSADTSDIGDPMMVMYLRISTLI